MPWILAAILICLAQSWVLADDEAHRPQISAAATEAADTLRREIFAASLGNDFTVGALVDRANARDQMNITLQSAEQIGGTRWLDDQTVQVRLELSGADIAKTIEQIAERNPKAAPMSMRALRERLKKDFSHRTFSATAASTAASAADRLRPDPLQVAWRGVSDESRRAAIEAAREAAIRHVLDSLRGVEWDYGKRHLADVLAVPQATETIRQWLWAQPITSIEFRDNLEVRLSLAASPRDLWPTLRATIEQTGVLVPKDPKEWEALRQQVDRHIEPAIGVAVAMVPVRNGPPAKATIALPQNQPVWSYGPPADAEGVSPPTGQSKLKTARAAEAIAREHLRRRVYALPLDQNMTLGEAAAKDPRFEQALLRGLADARIAKVDYDSPEPGAVRVTLTLDLQNLWCELGR